MKNDDEIQKRIRELLDEEFQRRLELSQARLPTSCKYNYRHPLDSRKLVDGEDNPQYNRITQDHQLPVVQTIGLCKYGTDSSGTWSGTICEEPIDARRCPPQAFTPLVTPEDVRSLFEEQIKDLAWVQENLPEVHGLLWVLGGGEPPVMSEPEPPKSEALVVHEEPAKLSGWQRFLLALGGLTKHRILPPESD